MQRFFGRFAATIISAMLLVSGSALAEFQKAVVNAEGVILREGADAQSAQVEKLPRGAEVTVLDPFSGWYQVEYGDLKGFVKQDQLTIKSVSTEMSATGKILLDDVKMRSKPATNASIVTQLKKGTVVEVSEKIENWFKVSAGKNKGYVRADYIELDVKQAEFKAYNTLKMGMSGKEVSSLQNALKELEYYKAEINGNYGAFTRDAVKAFQNANGLLADGLATPETQELLYSGSAAPAPQNTDASGGTVALDWFGVVESIFPIGAVAEVIDVRTGTSCKIQRVSGVLHADIETLTAKDTEALLEACSGEWSKEIRPVIVKIDGYDIAAALRPYPAGSAATLDNGMDGPMCLHFKGSKLADSRRVSPRFQAAVAEAVKYIPEKKESTPE